nr:protein CASC1 isoform X3 [Paramormyrops kingsleyae]
MSANKKRDKLSKVEKKKLQKEEDEQRQREEEAARLLAEQQELKRQEEERKEQEEHQRLELKDRERREDELSELRHLLDEMQNAVARWKDEASAKTKWERYMQCDGTPDPSIPQEINSFISLWREDTEVQIGSVLENCSLAQRLIEELEDLLNDTPQTAGSSSDTHRHQETILSLQELIHSKRNQATEEILKWSRANMDIETGNMQTVIQDADATLCLWANLNKNPRFKGYHFHEAGFGFELPKQLAVSDVAVRILHTRFDHLSCLSAGAHRISQGSIKSEESHPSTGEVGDEDTEQQGNAEESLDHKDEDSVRSETRKSFASVASEKEEKNARHDKEPEEQRWGEGRRDSLQEDTAIAGERDSYSPPEAPVTLVETEVVDLHQYTPLGGVFYFDAFRIPPQSQLVNGWDMREEPLIEQAAYEQMALLSCAVAFSWSRWNSHCGREQLVVQACEHLEAGPVPEKAWSLYLLNAERTWRLRMREQSESFSTALDGGSEFHATFLHMLRDCMGAPGHGRVRDADPFFVDCVLQLLMATRVLSYC